MSTPAPKAPSPAAASWWERTWVALAIVVVIQLLLVALVVMPQLSPRVSGTEIQLRVAPVDPIDPFRGAYVDLGYPDLPQPVVSSEVDPDRGPGYVPLRQDGEVWVSSGDIQRTQPDGLFLRCNDSDWRLRCGIESWFASQTVARQIEQQMMADGAIATVRVDRWGNAAIVGLRPSGG